MVQPKTKCRIALVIAGVIVLAAVLFVLALWYFIDRASNVERDPNNVAEDIVVSEEVVFEGIDWDYWLSVNPDIVGWIYIPDTNIDFPIVHAFVSDPTYYLSHDIYGSYNPMGAIYLDATSKGLFSGGNAVIFGHHWSQGRMFSQMANYSGYSWASEHSVIYIITPDDVVHEINVQGADVVKGSDPIKRTTFDDADDLMNYWQKRFAACDMTLVDEAQETEQLFTFVTCSYNFWNNERTVTYGIEDESTRVDDEVEEIAVEVDAE